MLLGELYDDAMLDRFIGYSVDVGKMDIASFKGILKEYNAGNLVLPDVDVKDTVESSGTSNYRDDDPALLRDCSYYEANACVEVWG